MLTPFALDPAHPLPRLLSQALSLAVLLEDEPRADPAPGHRPASPACCRALSASPAASTSTHARRPRRRRSSGGSSPGAGPRRRAVPRDAQRQPRGRRGGGARPAHGDRGGAAPSPARRHRPRRVSSKASDELSDQIRRCSTSTPSRSTASTAPSTCRGLMQVYQEVAAPDAEGPAAPSGARRPARRARTRCSRLREGDVLLHHPYESFEHVLDFVECAAARPARARDQADALPHGGDSPIVAALVRAAEDGKQVASCRAEGALRRGDQHRVGARARGERRPRRLRPRRPEDAREVCARRPARGRTASAATSTSAPATTTRRPRASTPTSGSSPRAERSAPTSSRALQPPHRLLAGRAKLERLLVAPFDAARRILALIEREADTPAPAGRRASSRR